MIILYNILCIEEENKVNTVNNTKEQEKEKKNDKNSTGFKTFFLL